MHETVPGVNILNSPDAVGSISARKPQPFTAFIHCQFPATTAACQHVRSDGIADDFLHRIA